VLWTQRCDTNFAVLKQREARWFRLDPRRVLGELRLDSMLPRRGDGSPGRRRDTLTLARWPNVGRYFHTARVVATGSERPVEELLAWIEKYQVGYLMCNPGVLEQLAFYCGERVVPSALAGMMSISGHLTGAMRSRLETTFGIPVHQNYGLNEVGIVAARCPGLTVTQTLVEIVDDTGQPVAPGQPGRVVVTALQNFAMPLLRYDTDDVAVVAAAGPCRCGRTLPSFARIEGRYRRYAFLPPGTRQLVNVLSDTLMRAPATLARELRRYQVHQCRDGSFEFACNSTARCPTR
jgi:phenylacetate-CoA ligase